jgi:general secretion pathway protein M
MISIVAAVALLTLMALWGGGLALDVYRKAQSRVTELEPRYARLQGIRAKSKDLESTDAKAAALLAQLAYPSTLEVTQAGNDAQQRLRTIFIGAGLEVISSQVLPAKAEKEFDRIPLSVRLEGELLGLQSALAVLSSQTPAILVEGFSVQVVGAIRADKPQRLTSQFSMYVLRVRP